MGIEDLTVQLPSSTRYPGHFQEEGYNAVQFTNAANCFARNLRVKNAGARQKSFLTCSGSLAYAAVVRVVVGGLKGLSEVTLGWLDAT
jgi:hypothetical protein